MPTSVTRPQCAMLRYRRRDSSLVIYCASIKELSVSDCRFVSDFGLREIAKLESRLQYLAT